MFKKKFCWNQAVLTDLVRLAAKIQVDGYVNWRKVYYTFKVMHPNFTGDQNDLRKWYHKVKDNELYSPDWEVSTVADAVDLTQKWTSEFQEFLHNALLKMEIIFAAQVRDGRKKKPNKLNIVVEEFKKQVQKITGAPYTGTDWMIRRRYYELKQKNLSMELSMQGENNFHEVFTLEGYASKNHTASQLPLFRYSCHNCGILFWRNQSGSSRKMLEKPLGNRIRILEVFNNMPFEFIINEKFVTCLSCFRNPEWVNKYDFSLSDSGKNEIPAVLQELNQFERDQIALCGAFSFIYHRGNKQRRVFEHRQGEFNIGRKRDCDIQNLYTIYYNTSRPTDIETSHEKIRNALLYLRKHNPLYQKFYSNYETLYGYVLRTTRGLLDEKIVQISKGSFEDFIGRDRSGVIIPAENVSRLAEFLSDYGMQHPKDMEQQFINVKEIVSVSYSDKFIEAKRWPVLFPEARGGFEKGGVLKPLGYLKWALLNVDPRFRRVNEFSFWWYDFLIKERLTYYNSRVRTVKTKELDQPLYAGEVKSSNRYGTVVPASIPGSKSFWRSRLEDLLAIVRDIGQPTLFVTLTQNDNWPELQIASGHLNRNEYVNFATTITPPANSGQDVISYPTETVIAFCKRLEMFMTNCIHKKNGPFGDVVDYWYRLEYQNRGALHAHMVIWACEETVPDNVVCAELPRYDGNDPDEKKTIFMCREYVKAFQLHECRENRCPKYKNGKLVQRCRFGFPFKVQECEELGENKLAYAYQRRQIEDSNVSPYNMSVLLLWNGHINVQRVTSNGLETYLCKYVSKPEKSIDIKNVSSDAEKFVKSRVVGILECIAHLLQIHHVQSSRKTIFLPCDFVPNQRVLKRRSHLPIDDESEDIYYLNSLSKYLRRPAELGNLTYPDLFRFYDIFSAKATVKLSPDNEFAKCDTEESDYDYGELQSQKSQQQKSIRANRKSFVSNGFKFVERGRAAIPRWRFLTPFGTDCEKYYEQLLLLNVPIFQSDLNESGYPFSDDNESKTFIEECCLRDLIDAEKEAKSALIGAIQHGFSVTRVLELASLLVDKNFVTKDFVDAIIQPWVESMPDNDGLEEEADESEFGEELVKLLEGKVIVEQYKDFEDKLSDSQSRAMDWVKTRVQKNDQILAIITGGQGCGKSFITKALYSFFREQNLLCVLLATTGSAANLISGTTVHQYLKIDIEGKCFMEKGTMAANIIEQTDVIIIDEFAMLTADTFEALNDITTLHGKNPRLPFGGINVFLIGDACQLPAIGTSLFTNPMICQFSVLVLKEALRQKEGLFVEILNRMRLDKLTEEDVDILRSRFVPISSIKFEADTLIVTATKKKMKHYNDICIRKLPGDVIEITAEDFDGSTNMALGVSDTNNVKKYCKDRWEDCLKLKEGCIVRLLRNINIQSGWVNSKRARVKRVARDGKYVILEDLKDPQKQLPLTKMKQVLLLGTTSLYRIQFPLILGYSTTVHAVQGTTVTGNYYVDLDRSFWESGQAYVAVSRAQSLQQLHFLNTHFEKVRIDTYYKKLHDWMLDVDELAIFKRPRILGDFPLQILPSISVSPEQFFPRLEVPRQRKLIADEAGSEKSGKHLETKNVVCGASETLNCSMFDAATDKKLNMLASMLLNDFRDGTSEGKLRSSVKFCNVLLSSINGKCNIQVVQDPIDVKLEKANETWDSLRLVTSSVALKCAITYREHLTLVTDLLLNFEIVLYKQQRRHLAIEIPEEYKNSIVPVVCKGDGRCFYHSVSKNLTGKDILSDTLKLLLSFDVLTHSNKYRPVLDRYCRSVEDIVVKILSYNEWADSLIALCMAIFLDRPIHSYGMFCPSLNALKTNFQYLPGTTYGLRDPILIAYVQYVAGGAQNHFIALLKRTKSNSLPLPDTEYGVIEAPVVTMDFDGTQSIVASNVQMEIDDSLGHPLMGPGDEICKSFVEKLRFTTSEYSSDESL